jgi:hypothetical protein
MVASIPSGSTAEQLIALNDRKFNVFEYSEDQLLGFSYAIFHQTGFLGTPQSYLLIYFYISRWFVDIEWCVSADTYIDGGRLKQFLLAVRKKYRNNPFHK